MRPSLVISNQMMSDIEKHRTPLMVQMDKLPVKPSSYYSGDDGSAVLSSVCCSAICRFPSWCCRSSASPLPRCRKAYPAIISIILSLGVQAMARRKAIIRKLPTVETLGAMTVICSG